MSDPVSEMLVDLEKMTPEELGRLSDSLPVEYRTTYRTKEGFEYSFSPHFMFRCNDTAWRLLYCYGVELSFGLELNGPGVFDRCHKAVESMVDFLAGRITGSIVDVGQVFNASWQITEISGKFYAIVTFASGRKAAGVDNSLDIARKSIKGLLELADFCVREIPEGVICPKLRLT